MRVGDIVKYWNPFWERNWIGMVLEIKEELKVAERMSCLNLQEAEEELIGEKEQKEFLNEKNLTDLKAIAKTLEIPLKYGGKHKSKSTLVNEIYEKEKEELKNLNN